MYWGCREAPTRSISHYVVLSGLTTEVKLAAYQRDFRCDCHGDVEPNDPGENLGEHRLTARSTVAA